MDVDYLREYLTVAGELNFTRAARLLNTTQSTLSKHVAALEREFGAALIDRGGKTPELTQAGAALFRRARALVGEYDAAKEEVRAIASSPNVRVGGMLRNGETLDILSKVTAALRAQERPAARYQTVGVDVSPESLCGAGAPADVVISHSHGSEPEGVSSVGLLRNPFVAIVEEGHPLAGRSEVSLAELEPYPISQLISGYDQAGWDFIRDVCERHGFEPRKYPIVVGDIPDLLTEPLGDAVLILTSSIFPGGLQPYAGRRTVRVTDPDAAFELRAYYRSADTGRLAGFLGVLAEAAAQVQGQIDHPQAASQRPFQTRCRKLAEAKGLNASETEAMIGFAKGRSVDRIGAEMGLTRLMVGDLLASVYNKVGVRDKQDLLDAIEAVPLG